MSRGRDRRLTGQVGEFLVSAELGRRKLIATPFAGNVPTFDIIVADEQCRTLPIQVKSTTASKWVSKANHWMHIDIEKKNKRQVFKDRRAISNPDLIYVCVAISSSPEKRDRFFVLTRKQLQEVCIKHYCGFMDPIEWRRPRNYKSFSLRYSIDDVLEYEDNWALIESELARRPSALIVGE